MATKQRKLRPGEAMLRRLEDWARQDAEREDSSGFGQAIYAFAEHSHPRQPEYLRVNFNNIGRYWTYTLGFEPVEAGDISRELAMWMLGTEDLTGEGEEA